LAKQNQEQQKVLTSLNHGIPLVASSPVANDINMGLPSPSLIEVQYQAGGPWKPYSNRYATFPSDITSQAYSTAVPSNFHETVLNEFASEDESNCFEASQFSEERSDNSCDGSAASQLTVL
jgi:hypothetical protein